MRLRIGKASTGPSVRDVGLAYFLSLNVLTGTLGPKRMKALSSCGIQWNPLMSSMRWTCTSSPHLFKSFHPSDDGLRLADLPLRHHLLRYKESFVVRRRFQRKLGTHESIFPLQRLYTCRSEQNVYECPVLHSYQICCVHATQKSEPE